ncbi:hypothetical protein [Geminicoccus flavidas]|uniref:hypothetical protein n=1 Tax=Geminicoccus flavidas TaxID=2506407 RepID=UPI00135738F6|nr:hypothetical protein [Geminicoccus flavidas]
MREFCQRLIEAAYRAILSDSIRRQRLLPDLAVRSAAGVGGVERTRDEILCVLRRIEADKGIPLAVLHAVLRQFGEAGPLPDDPVELQRRLEAKANEYRTLDARPQSLVSDDPVVAEARAAARAAVDQGDFQQACHLLSKAVDLELDTMELLAAYTQAKQCSAAHGLILLGRLRTSDSTIWRPRAALPERTRERIPLDWAMT